MHYSCMHVLFSAFLLVKYFEGSPFFHITQLIERKRAFQIKSPDAGIYDGSFCFHDRK